MGDALELSHLGKRVKGQSLLMSVHWEHSCRRLYSTNCSLQYLTFEVLQLFISIPDFEVSGEVDLPMLSNVFHYMFLLLFVPIFIQVLVL